MSFFLVDVLPCDDIWVIWGCCRYVPAPPYFFITAGPLQVRSRLPVRPKPHPAARRVAHHLCGACAQAKLLRGVGHRISIGILEACSSCARHSRAGGVLLRLSRRAYRYRIGSCCGGMARPRAAVAKARKKAVEKRKKKRPKKPQHFRRHEPSCAPRPASPCVSALARALARWRGVVHGLLSFG